MQSRLMLRMFAPTMAVSLSLLVLGSAAAWYVHYREEESATALLKNVERVSAAEELLTVSHDLRHELSLYLATEDERHLEKATQQKQEAEALIARCADLSENAVESELVQRIRRGYSRYYDSFGALAGPARPRDPRPVVVELIRDVTTREIMSPVREYRELIGRGMEQAARHDQALADRMGLGLFVFGACGAVAGLVAGLGFARSLHRSILQLTVPIHDAAGKLNEVVGPIDVSGEDLGALETTMLAVSERVGTVVQELQESYTSARRTEELASLGQLAAGIAHELRNPLTSMKVIVQTAVEGETADGRDLSVLMEDISRIETTIQSFLDYARPPALLRRPVLIRDEIERAVDVVSERAVRMGVHVEPQIPESSFMVDADPVQLRQVLLNLLNNALDVSPEGGTIRVRMTFEPTCGEDGQPRAEKAFPRSVRVDVEDEGPGLPPDVRERIFEPFTTTKDGGTGLGLAICKRIVDQHGGEISAADRPNGGAVFSVRLPIGCGERTNGAAREVEAAGVRRDPVDDGLM